MLTSVLAALFHVSTKIGVAKKSHPGFGLANSCQFLHFFTTQKVYFAVLTTVSISDSPPIQHQQDCGYSWPGTSVPTRPHYLPGFPIYPGTFQGRCFCVQSLERHPWHWHLWPRLETPKVPEIDLRFGRDNLMEVAVHLKQIKPGRSSEDFRSVVW